MPADDPSPLNFIVYFGPYLLLSLGFTVLLTPVLRRLAISRNIVDRPDDWLKPHKKPIPYLGGVAIFLGWAAGLLLAARSAKGPEFVSAMGVIAAGTFTMGIGLFDDLHLASPRARLLAMALIGILLVICGVGARSMLVLAGPLGAQLGSVPSFFLSSLSAPLTIFVIVGACNATNMLDGTDGLCAGVLAIAAIGFLTLQFVVQRDSVSQDPSSMVLALATLGGALGFLWYNRHPATIFMGDAGSMLLGLSAALLILGAAERGGVAGFLGGVLVFGVPIADMTLTIVRRWRNGRPLMKGDRSHFYDQLVDRGYSVRRVVRMSYLAGFGYACLGCLLAVLSTGWAAALFAAVIVATAVGVVRAKMVRVDRAL